MSNSVFPSWLPGLMFTSSKKPTWATNIQSAISGRESRQQRTSSPLYHFSLQFEYLYDAGPRTNYIPYSQDFTQAGTWALGTGTTVLPNPAIAPDGTQTADLILYNGLGAAGGARVTGSGRAASAGEVTTSSVWLMTYGGAASLALQLSDGSGATPVNIAVGPAWQRFSFTSAGYAAGVTRQLILSSPSSVNTPFMVYAWGGQLEDGVITTRYIPTFGSASIVSDLKTLLGFANLMQGMWDTFLYTDPSFNTVAQMQFGVGTGALTVYQLTANYSPDGLSGFSETIQNTNGAPFLYVTRYGCPELQSAVSRTNLLLQSQTLATAPWSTSNLTATNAASTAPDGTATACALKETTANSSHSDGQAVTVPSAVEQISFTAWLNPNLTRTWAELQMVEGTGGTAVSVYFNLSGAGSVGSTPATGANWANLSYSIQQAANGFYRCSITATKTNAATSVTGSVFTATADNTSIYAGNASNGVTAWGTQLEIGPYPTAYLPTTGATASATDYSIGSTGLVTYSVAPANQAILTWSGSFYYRCRFSADDPEVSNFLANFWEAKKIDFQQVKL